MVQGAEALAKERSGHVWAKSEQRRRRKDRGQERREQQERSREGERELRRDPMGRHSGEALMRRNPFYGPLALDRGEEAEMGRGDHSGQLYELMRPRSPMPPEPAVDGAIARLEGGFKCGAGCSGADSQISLAGLSFSQVVCAPSG